MSISKESLLALCLISIFSFKLVAKTKVAIIDSGVDYKHESLQDLMWKNLLEIPDNNRDEDGNGYEDDIYGWNFAEDNDRIIEYKYLGSFSDDPYKFFEVQARGFQGKTTDSDREWISQKRKDPAFMAEMQIFGNFVHGTHVAAIASGRDESLEIMGIKLLPTEVKLPVKLPKFGKGKKKSKKKKKIFKVSEKYFNYALKALANAQNANMENIAVYLDGHNVSIANGSFGMGFHQAANVISMMTNLLSKIGGYYDGDPAKLAKNLIAFAAESGKKYVSLAPDTLFVFAAGNDGLNNDEFGTSPANIRADNVITVAATYDNHSIANFSNYGQKVHVAAPGVIINSAIPGNEYLKVSGTSQAAPYVANLAGKIKEANSELNPKQIKEILMRTVSKAHFLDGKVETSGFVNEARALKAAHLSRDIELAEAIKQVEDKTYVAVPSIKTKFGVATGIESIMPLTPIFK